MKSYHPTLILLLSLLVFNCSGSTPGEHLQDNPTELYNGEVISAVEDTIEQDALATDANLADTRETPVKPTLVIADPAQRGKVTLGTPEGKKVERKKKEAAPKSSPSPAASSQTAPPVRTSVPEPSQEQPSTPTVSYPDHGSWNNLLSEHVNGSGTVSYSALKKSEQMLDDYLAMLAESTPGSDWDRNEAKAYWLNAYNAFTVKLILNNYPVKKITDLHGGKPWDVKWIKLAGKTYSLNQIEHDIIRPTYKDPRIHFAVNCAAQSCPPLYNRAFTAAGLSGTLTSLTKRFINNDKYNDLSENSGQVSKLFEWYAEDFGDVVTYLNKYADVQLLPTAEIGFKDYDWSLNGR